MKKTIIITLLALLGIAQTVAQEYEYVPFVREGVKWYYSYKDQTDFAHEYFFTLEMKGEVAIDGKTYKAMHKYGGKSINWDNDTIPVYLREEDKVVYGIVPDGKTYVECPVGNEFDQEMMALIADGKEFILYDFNKPIEFIESWMNYSGTYWCTVIPDIISVAGKEANRYIFINQCLIEGIGYDAGFKAYPLALQNRTRYPVYLSHVTENGETIYRSESQKQTRESIPPLVREGVQWVNERVIIENGDTTRTYYNYEFKGTDDYHDNPLCYMYSGEELDVNTATVAAMFLTDYDLPRVTDYNVMYNKPLESMVEQGRNMISLGYQLYRFDGENSDILMDYPINFYIYRQKEAFLSRQNFFEVDPVEIDGHECRRYAFVDEQGNVQAYVVEGIGFDSRDMGDLLTPFTRKPDPDADYQEYCGLSHVIKDGKIIYKGLRYRPDQPGDVNGDVNCDGEVTIADANNVVDIVVMGGNSGHTRSPAADVNGDGEINIADINAIINIIISNNQQ